MTPYRIVLIVTLSALGVLAFAGIGATAFGIGPAVAHSFGGHRGGGHFCAHLSPAHVAAAEVWIAVSLDLDDQQRAAFTPLADAARGWTTDVGALCSGGTFTSVPQALTTSQSMLLRTAEAVEQLRAHYDAFEASLDEAQRAQIREHFAKHQQRHEG